MSVMIPLVLTMGRKSLSEGVGILCGICGVHNTQTFCWITLNIPTADVIMVALGTGVLFIRPRLRLLRLATDIIANLPDAVIG